MCHNTLGTFPHLHPTPWMSALFAPAFKSTLWQSIRITARWLTVMLANVV
tara:strand:- start:694 stop:843 length:150 start_codon:yes stop_codon:yes gene_type:complete